MRTKTLEEIIASLMVFYGDYREACEECVELNGRFDSEEYQNATEKRDRYARYIREDIDALKALGIKFERFDYI